VSQQVKTAVFPVAGLGTRFLPITKTGPKEMLPIVDKPLIQYVVQEAIDAGITQLIFVTSSSKRAIEDYFDRHFELERHLAERGKTSALAMIKSMVPEHVSIVYIRQPSPAGLGDAVWQARNIVGDEPFAVLLADDIIDCGQRNCLQGMMQVYEKTKASVLAVDEVNPQETDQYGIVSAAQPTDDAFEVNGIIEKPAPSEAPSRFGVVGRYILSPKIFELLSATAKGVGGEVQLTDAIAALLRDEKVMAFPFDGKRYDCGSKLGFVEATIAYALQRPELGDQLRLVMRDLLVEPARQKPTSKV